MFDRYYLLTARLSARISIDVVFVSFGNDNMAKRQFVKRVVICVGLTLTLALLLK